MKNLPRILISIEKILLRRNVLRFPLLKERLYSVLFIILQFIFSDRILSTFRDEI